MLGKPAPVLAIVLMGEPAPMLGRPAPVLAIPATVVVSLLTWTLATSSRSRSWLGWVFAVGWVLFVS